MTRYTVTELTQYVGGEVVGENGLCITGLASLSRACEGQLACLFHDKQMSLLAETQASCILLRREHVTTSPLCSAIIVESPLEAFALLMPKFTETFKRSVGIEKTVSLGRDVRVGKSISIAANTVIGDDVSIGDNVSIGSNVTLGNAVAIADNAVINNNVTIGDHVSLGKNVCIDSGAVIGANPFNPLKTKGVWCEGGVFGNVIIAEGVSIGANTVVDRGVHSDTFIAKGVKIDNLVQVAHDVIIGEHSIVVAGAAIGANTVIGEHCTVGGCSSIAGHLSIVNDVVITGTAAVTRSIRQQGIYSSGTTVERHKRWRKNVARFHRLDLMAARVRKLEKTMRRLFREGFINE